MPFTLEKTEEIEAHLAKNPYLSEGGLPGAADAEIYFALNGGNFSIIQLSPMSTRPPASTIGITSSTVSQTTS